MYDLNDNGEEIKSSEREPEDPYACLEEPTGRFKATMKMLGQNLLHFNEFRETTDKRVKECEKTLEDKIFRNEFKTMFRDETAKFKSKIKAKLESMETKLINMDRTMETSIKNFDKKLHEVEVNTYWKIKDYEELLQTRINEQYVKDYFKAQEDKLKKSFVEYFQNEMPKYERFSKELARNLKRTDEEVKEQGKTVKEMSDTVKSKVDRIDDLILKSNEELETRMKKEISQLNETQGSMREKQMNTLRQIEKLQSMYNKVM